MAHYDLNNKHDSAQFGGVIVGLIGLFWLGLFASIYVGVSPFWQRANGGLSHFWFALWGC